MEPVIISRVTIEDIAALQQLSISTFTDTYAAYNTAEDMANHVATHFSETVLMDELNAADSFFFFAKVDNVIAGYIKLRTSHQPLELATWQTIEIERIYTDKTFHGKGIGYALIAYALLFAAELQKQVVWLGVWKQNEKAIAFYQRQGFEIFGEHVFVLGQDEQWDWLMKKHLAG